MADTPQYPTAEQIAEVLARDFGSDAQVLNAAGDLLVSDGSYPEAQRFFNAARRSKSEARIWRAEAKEM